MYIFEVWSPLLTSTGVKLAQKLFKLMRLKNFPAGCGKGHDTAVIGAWLNDELSKFDPASSVGVARRVFTGMPWVIFVLGWWICSWWEP